MPVPAMRRGAWIQAAACLLALASPPPAEAAETPCRAAGLSPAVAGLETRLARTTDRVAWATVAVDAEALARASDSALDRACAHYQAAAAHFFLSDRGEARARHAAGAVRHLLAAAVLTPDHMSGLQPRARLETAWRRFVGPAARGGLRPVVLGPAAPGVRLALLPTAAEAWIARCGGGPACADAVVLELPALTAPVTLPLVAGRFILRSAGPCGVTDLPLTVEAAGAIHLNPPSPAVCTAYIRAFEGETPLVAFTVDAGEGPRLAEGAAPVPGGESVVVAAPGYVPVRVNASAEGGELAVRLERCPVTLVIDARPADASVAGAGPGPWGARDVRVERAGYAPRAETVAVPRPETCEAARHEVTITLERPVAVAALGPDGATVALASLTVAGAAVSPAGFTRAPGRHPFRAVALDHGEQTGALEVPPCEQPDCPAAVLRIRFGGAPARPSRKGPIVVSAVGGAAVLGGLVAGLAALQTQRELDAYTNKQTEGRGVDALLEQRDRQARLADGLVAAGVLGLGAGLAWYLLAGEAE